MAVQVVFTNINDYVAPYNDPNLYIFSGDGYDIIVNGQRFGGEPTIVDDASGWDRRYHVSINSIIINEIPVETVSTDSSYKLGPNTN